jgi:hypothetical protein
MIAALLCALPLFELFIAPAADVRRVSFRDRLTPSLAGYQSGARALLRTDLSIYPLGHSGLPGVSDIGFFGSYGRSLKSQTLTSDGALAFTTQEIAWDAGARFRGVIDGQERFAASMRYGSLRNDFSGNGLPGVVLPSGTVQYWRPGISGRLPLPGIVLGAELGYLLLVKQDALGAVFPRSSSAGADAAVHASMELNQFEVRLSLRYTRLFYSLHPLPFDPYIAGGALDELVAVDLAFGLRL